MIETISQTLGAGGSLISSMEARSLYIKEAANPVTVTFFDRAGKFLGKAESVEEGYSIFFGLEAKPMTFKVETVSGQTVTVMTSLGEIRRDKTLVSSLTVPTERSQTVETLVDVQIVGGVGGSTAVVYAGHADTMGVLISNLSANSCRIGDVNTAANRGGVLEGYQSQLLDTGGAIYAHVLEGETVDFAITVFKV